MQTIFEADTVFNLFAMRLCLTVIPAGNDGIQNTGMCSKLAILGLWVPAFPAGTTLLPLRIDVIPLNVGYVCKRPKCVDRFTQRERKRSKSPLTLRQP
jgi:hypothetical protein